MGERNIMSAKDVLSAVRHDCELFQRMAALKGEDLHDLCPVVPATIELIRMADAATAALPFYTDLKTKPIYPLLSHIFNPSSSAFIREIEFIAWIAVRNPPPNRASDLTARSFLNFRQAFAHLVGLAESFGVQSATLPLRNAFQRFARNAEGLIDLRVQKVSSKLCQENDPQRASYEVKNNLRSTSEALAKKEEEVVRRRREARGDIGMTKCEYTIPRENGEQFVVHYFYDGSGGYCHFREEDSTYKTFDIIKNATAYYARRHYEADHAEKKQTAAPAPKGELTNIFLKAARETQKLVKATSAASDYYLGLGRNLLRRRLATALDPAYVRYLTPLRALCGAFTSEELQTPSFQETFALLDGTVTSLLDSIEKAIPADDAAHPFVARLTGAWKEFLIQAYQAFHYEFQGEAHQRVTDAFNQYADLLAQTRNAVADFERRFADRKNNPPKQPTEESKKEDIAAIMAELKAIRKGISTNTDLLSRGTEILEKDSERLAKMDRKADLAHKQEREHQRKVDEDAPKREYKKPESTVQMIKHGLGILKDDPNTPVNKAASLTVEWAMKKGIIPRIPKTEKAYHQKVAVMNTTLSRAWEEAKKTKIA